MPTLADLCSDLHDEHLSLDELVESLEESGWDTPTPAEGWTIGDQVSHLAFFDEAGAMAMAHPERFAAGLEDVARDVDSFMNAPIEKGRSLAGREVLGWWHAARTEMLDVFRVADPGIRVPWYGPWMKPASFISARLMETWAHGQDVADALSVRRTPTDRLKHIAFLGFRARPFSYATHGRPEPDTPVKVELRGPRGGLWSWGEGPDSVRGTALDFCLVVTQRRHLGDTALECDGPSASEWMSIAQAFAGPPGGGRRRGQFDDLDRSAG
jgi:uncharacterized protein (TIGR03084 family)